MKENQFNIEDKVFDYNLQPESLTILLYCLIKQKEEKIKKIDIQNKFNIGKDKLSAIFNELESNGFLIKTKNKKMQTCNYTFLDNKLY